MSQNSDVGLSAPLPELGARSAGASAARRVAALAAMLAVYFLAYFQRAAVPGTIFNELQQDLARNGVVSASAITGLGAAFFYVYGGMQIVVGVAADRYGGRRTFLFGGAVMCAGALAFPFCHDPVTLYATRILVAVGSSFVYLSIVKELVVLFPPHRFVPLLGMVVAVGYLGSVTATLPFERAVHAWGWRPSLAAVGAISAAGLVVAWATLRRLDHSPSQHAGLPMHLLWGVLRNRRCWPLLAGSLINFPVLFCMQSVLGKKFLQDVTGMSSQAAASFVLAVALASAAASFCGGLALRLTRQRRRPVIISGPSAVLAATLLMLAGVLLHAPAWTFLTAYVLLGLASVSFPAGSATMKELNRPDAVAVAISVSNGISYAGVGVLSNAAGAVLDVYRGSATAVPGGIVYPSAAYAAVLGGLAALAALSLLIAIFLVPETRGVAVTLEEIERELA